MNLLKLTIIFAVNKRPLLKTSVIQQIIFTCLLRHVWLLDKEVITRLFSYRCPYQRPRSSTVLGYALGHYRRLGLIYGPIWKELFITSKYRNVQKTMWTIWTCWSWRSFWQPLDFRWWYQTLDQSYYYKWQTTTTTTTITTTRRDSRLYCAHLITQKSYTKCS